MIKISELPLITDSTQLQDAKLILLVDVIHIGDAPRTMREYIKANHGGFVYQKETYMPITLTGNPESLIANAEKGIHFKFDRGFENLYILQGDIDYTIRRKKLYDLSAYIDQNQIGFEREEAFVIKRYLAGDQEPVPHKHHAADSMLTQPLPSIGLKSMGGLKPVRKPDRLQ